MEYVASFYIAIAFDVSMSHLKRQIIRIPQAHASVKQREISSRILALLCVRDIVFSPA